MASWKELYKAGGFWTLDQLGSKVITGDITSCEVVDRSIKGKSVTKLEITIGDDDKPFILSRDNAERLAKAYGDDTDDWLGKKVRAARGKVKFGKATVPGIILTPLNTKAR